MSGHRSWDEIRQAHLAGLTEEERIKYEAEHAALLAELRAEVGAYGE